MFGLSCIVRLDKVLCHCIVIKIVYLSRLIASVCLLTDDIKLFLYIDSVDMYKQFLGLQGFVNEEFRHHPKLEEAFVFIDTTRLAAKILFYVSDG